MDSMKQSPIGVNYREVWRRIWKRRSLFYKVLPATFILSSIYICALPRYYTTETQMAPETENGFSGGSIGTLASSFGIDLNAEGTDAITPMLYPDLLEDNGFITSLFSIVVENEDGDIHTTYYDYLLKHQKKSPWGAPLKWISSLFKKSESATEKPLDPYFLTKTEDNIVGLIRKHITCTVDKKTGVITIGVTDQDRVICKTIADSTRVHLQEHITEYRTNKARIDMKYYSQLTEQARAEYEEARQRYARYGDSHIGNAITSVRSRSEDLENDMQLKYTTYTTLNTQLQASIAKVQERTPAFTLLKGAAVPMKPSQPKRMIFVAVMLLLATAVCSCYILWDILVPDDKAQP